MQLNATLIVQIGHFWIAYLILRYLVLSPFVRYLTDQKRSSDNLMQMIEDRKHSIISKEKESSDQIESCQQFYKITAPLIKEETEKFHNEYVQVQPELDLKGSGEAIEHIKGELIKKVVRP